MQGKISEWKNQDHDPWYCWEIHHGGRIVTMSDGDWQSRQEAWDDLNEFVAAFSKEGIVLPPQEAEGEGN